MKPRPFFNLAAAVSLLLAIAIVGLWVRSYGRRDTIERDWRTSTERCGWRVKSAYCSLEFMIARSRNWDSSTMPPLYRYNTLARADDLYAGPVLWFPFPPVRFLDVLDNPHLRPTYVVRRYVVAYWLLLAPTLVLPAVAVVRHRRRRRRERENLCPACGYDLRATPDRCPECGMVVGLVKTG